VNDHLIQFPGKVTAALNLLEGNAQKTGLIATQIVFINRIEKYFVNHRSRGAHYLPYNAARTSNDFRASSTTVASGYLDRSVKTFGASDILMGTPNMLCA
jgi:hypothetical protein